MFGQTPTPKQALRTARILGLGLLSVTTAFAIGMRSANDVTPIAPIQANELLTLTGDLNGDGLVTMADVDVALTLSQGRLEPTLAQLRADPNHDGAITEDDALAILRSLPPAL